MQTLKICSINIQNFKNYSDYQLVTDKKIIAFTGNNGAGKTNLLDAIFFLSYFRSYFNSNDKDIIRKGQDFFYVSAIYENESERHEVSCGYKSGEQKVSRFDKKNYTRLSDHFGKFPIVMIAPYDTDLIREGSDIRRKFFDLILSFSDKKYLQTLQAYAKCLEQRNYALKMFAEKGRVDMDLLEQYNSILATHADFIFLKRKDLIGIYKKIFGEYYNAFCTGNELPGIEYASRLLENNLNELLQQNLEKDLSVGYTTAGVHKDDYLFTINDSDCKKNASQGQQKSFVTALKLTQYKLMKEWSGTKPVVLLDDIFDRLDEQRSSTLMDFIHTDEFGQVFITDTHPERIAKYFVNSDELLTFKVENGTVNKIEPQI